MILLLVDNISFVGWMFNIYKMYTSLSAKTWIFHHSVKTVVSRIHYFSKSANFQGIQM